MALPIPKKWNANTQKMKQGDYEKMDLLEYYHRTGKCPDRYYNQLNGKTADENYQAILARRQEYYRELLA